MALQSSVAARNAEADSWTTSVGNGAKVRLYSGTPPADVAAAITGTLLVEWTGGTPFAPDASGGALSPTLPTAVAASASGTATHWRVYRSDGTTAVFQGTAGTSGTDMILDSATIVSGVPTYITAWTMTPGGA